MGITGEIVRSIFSKSRSIRTNASNIRSNSERRRWRKSVRSYLCGDEFNSVLAEEDSASVKSSKVTSVYTQPEVSSVFAEEGYASSVRSSEATVTQPEPQELNDEGDAEIKENKEDVVQQEKQNSTSTLFRKDDAAIVIQSAFRSFLARRQEQGLELMCGNEELAVGKGSPSKESVGTSIEVQTGNSTEVHSFREDLPPRVQQKARSHVLKLKEDWDDSTVSSNISKLKIQKRLEASTRRERALAYAFSQQLRVCSRKKQTKSESDGTEFNMGWSWLERWMATRQQENYLTDITKQFEPLNSNQKSMAQRRLLFDISGEKESCGSNEVSIQFDNISISTLKEEYPKPLQDKLTPTSVSRRKTVPSCHYPKETVKVIKKECAREDETDKTHKTSAGHKREPTDEDNTSQVSPEQANPKTTPSWGFDLSEEH